MTIQEVNAAIEGLEFAGFVEGETESGIIGVQFKTGTPPHQGAPTTVWIAGVQPDDISVG